MQRIDPDDVCRRYRELRLEPIAGSLGIIDINGRFDARHPNRGVCGLGVLVLGERVPAGFPPDRLQEAVNATLGLEMMYAWGFYDGFARWPAPLSFAEDIDPDLLASYAVGQVDGAETWKICNPIRKSKQTIQGVQPSKLK